MNSLLIIISIIYQINLQSNIAGVYADKFGSEIELKADSTFHYQWRFDLSSSWTNGIWKFSNDTIYFTIIPVLDTLTFESSASYLEIDSLVLSSDGKSEKVGTEDYGLSSLASGGQNRQPIPKRLYFKKNKLYRIRENGKLQKKKVSGISNKKYYSYYLRKK